MYLMKILVQTPGLWFVRIMPEQIEIVNWILYSDKQVQPTGLDWNVIELVVTVNEEGRK